MALVIAPLNFEGLTNPLCLEHPSHRNREQDYDCSRYVTAQVITQHCCQQVSRESEVGKSHCKAA